MLQRFFFWLVSGSVGERSAEVRKRATRRLRFVGIALDDGRNRSAEPDVDISAGDATVRTVVIAAREELQIAIQTRELLGVPPTTADRKGGVGHRS